MTTKVCPPVFGMVIGNLFEIQNAGRDTLVSHINIPSHPNLQ